jgi:hypothetical protein
MAAAATAQTAAPTAAPVATPIVAPAAAATIAPAAPTALRPYEASYELVTHGLDAGVSSFELRQDGADTWTFVSRNRPRGLFRLFSAASLTLTSHMRVGSGGVQPLLFTATPPDGGAPGAEVHFDWDRNRATGVQEDTPIDMPLKAGVQDDLSVQIALMHALLAGQTPAGIAMFDKNGIRDYDYARVGDETLHTAVGEVATVIYESHKANSPRRTRFWCAPQYGYVPMRAEQKRDGQVEWTMSLRSVQLH